MKENHNNNCCGKCSLPSHDNEIEILIRQLKREVKELINTTQAKLLCQDNKIAECCTYIKNNLSNYLRELLDSMLQSGEIDEIIESVLSNSLELVQEDINIIKDELNIVKDNITDLKINKLEFEEIEEFNINTKFKNVDIETDYTNDSIIYITKIKNIDKIACLPTNGNKTANVLEGRTDILNFANEDNNYDVYMNAGMNGLYIFDGIINQSTRLDCPYYCGIKENNEMEFYEGLTQEITPTILLNDHIKNCFSGFAPIIVNHELADYTSINNLYGNNQIATNFIDSLPVKHPRQILAQDDDNNFYILSIMGRFNNSKGFNYNEMKDYCYNRGFKNAFNCDGGGSMQTIYNKNYVFYPSQELDTNIDRIVPSALCFKVREVE